MFQAIVNYLRSSENKVTHKEDVRSLTEATFAAISKEVIPSLKNVSDSAEYFKSERIYVLSNMGGSLDLKTDRPEEVIKVLTKFFKDILAEEKDFISLIDAQANDKVFPALANAQEVAVMKTISDISSVTLYVLDLLYYIILGEESQYPVKKIAALQESVPYFTAIVRNYNNRFDKHVSDLAKISKNEVKLDAPVNMMDKLLAKHGKLVSFPLINGFINNPIYHIRLWVTDREIEKYEALKEKKKLLELKLLDLKLRASEKHDEKLIKQVQYYEDKISGIEYELKDIEG